jgi:hypothetical protein
MEPPDAGDPFSDERSFPKARLIPSRKPRIHALESVDSRLARDRQGRNPSDPRTRWSVRLIPTLAHWHEIVERRDPRGLDALLAEQVVFHSPVVHTPQVGKAVTIRYLSAALHVFGNESFRYVREVVGAHDAVLEFEVEIDGVQVNGVDMLRWNDDGLIMDFTVMVRPLKAIAVIHERMAAMLQAHRKPSA